MYFGQIGNTKQALNTGLTVWSCFARLGNAGDLALAICNYPRWDYSLFGRLGSDNGIRNLGVWLVFRRGWRTRGDVRSIVSRHSRRVLLEDFVFL